MPFNKPTSPETALIHVTSALRMLTRRQVRLETVLLNLDGSPYDYDNGREEVRTAVFDIRAARVHLTQAQRMLDPKGLFPDGEDPAAAS